MDLKKELNNIFLLYSKGEYEKAQELNNKILESFPNNSYAKRYEKILAEKIGKKAKEKKVKIKGKTLKCPHCQSKISFSALTENQREKIKKGNYNNLEIKCPYCHTKFVLQKRKSNSMFGIKIGDIANIYGKKYRVTGYVEYSGNWYEDGYSGRLKYLEWLLLGEDNSYLYFSEGKSYDDGEWEEEFEISEKYIPKNIGEINYDSKIARVDGKGFYLKEKDIVKVVSIYGENSKNTIVGEKVELYDFGDFIIEKENSGSQKEAGFYKSKKISGSEVAKIFGKKYENKQYDYSTQGSSVYILFIFFIALPVLFSFIPEKYISIAIFYIFVLPIYYIFKNKIPKDYKIIVYGILLAPIFIFLVFGQIFNSFLEKKQLVKLENLKQAEKVEVVFNKPSLTKNIRISSKRYDYGGVRTYYKRNTGLKFSVKNDEDKKIIEKIVDMKNKGVNNKLVDIFSGPIYKLK